MNNNEIIKANKKYEGQFCKICKKEIQIGDLIHICPNCQSINHEDCWNMEGGCNNFSCQSLSSKKTSNLASKFKSLDDPVVEQKPQLPPNMVPCRWCKEPILRGSKLCKHCHEYQRDEDRKKAKQSEDNYGYENTTLSGIDWFLLLMCTGVALIMGIYNCIAGNSNRGLKLIKYSIIITLIAAVIRATLNYMLSH